MGRVPLPTCLQYVDNLQVHKVQFDPTKCTSGLSLSHRNTCVTQTVSTSNHKSIYGTQGFAANTGSHFWSFEIIDRGVNPDIMIGISDGTTQCVPNTYAGKGSCNGCSLSILYGYFYRCNTSYASPLASQTKTASHIGVLLNTDHKTVSFFVDGLLVGMGCGSDVMTSGVYFPVVSVSELGHCVVSDDVNGNVNASKDKEEQNHPQATSTLNAG
eukprot:PhF_6_TR24446/c0_g1_i1/m.33804